MINMSNAQEKLINYSGLAALSICESLLIELADRKLLSDHEVQGLLEDAAAAHRNAKGTPQELEAHRAVAAIIERLQGRTPFVTKLTCLLSSCAATSDQSSSSCRSSRQTNNLKKTNPC